MEGAQLGNEDGIVRNFEKKLLDAMGELLVNKSTFVDSLLKAVTGCKETQDVEGKKGK